MLGTIALGISAMTDYFHRKTALMPRITIREPRRFVGCSTRQAMLVGAVHGYRGLIRGLLGDLREELQTRRLPVVATGGLRRIDRPENARNRRRPAPALPSKASASPGSPGTAPLDSIHFEPPRFGRDYFGTRTRFMTMLSSRTSGGP